MTAASAFLQHLKTHLNTGKLLESSLAASSTGHSNWDSDTMRTRERKRWFESSGSVQFVNRNLMTSWTWKVFEFLNGPFPASFLYSGLWTNALYKSLLMSGFEPGCWKLTALPTEPQTLANDWLIILFYFKFQSIYKLPLIETELQFWSSKTEIFFLLLLELRFTINEWALHWFIH